MTTTLKVREAGHGGPLTLVFVHPLGASDAVWEEVATAFIPRFRCVFVSLPGHGGAAPAEPGLSISSLAHALIERSLEDQWGDFVCIGVSIGGAIALETALLAPAGLRATAIVCSAARIGAEESWRERAALVRKTGTGALIDQASKRWFAEGFSSKKPEVVGELMNNLLHCDDESYALHCEALASWDRRSDLQHISLPTLVISGELDVATTVDEGMAMSENIEDSFFASLPGVAHFCPVENPVDTAGIIDRFLHAVLADQTSPRRTQGFQTRRKVLGDAHVTGAQRHSGRYGSLFHDFITRYAWGGVWSRPGLDPRTRSIATLTALVSTGEHHELAMHIRAAQRHGLSNDEIAELFIHVSIYAGLPKSNQAFRVLADVLEEDES